METSLEDVERDLLLWAGRVAAGEAELLRLIGEWDAREGWGAAGALSCAQWLSWKLGLSPGASREKVRVARSLRSLPLAAARMAAGGLTYSQARAITRVATADDEQTWLDLAALTTAVQLEKAVRGVQRARQPAKDAVADPEELAFRDRVRQRWDDAGNLQLTLVISAAQAPAVVAALERSQAAVQADRDTQIAAVAAGLAVAQDVPAGTPEGPPEEYYYAEPDYPGMRFLGWLPSEKPDWLQDKIKAWHVEKDRLQAKARAWADHQQRIEQAAHAAGAITAKATLADGLIRLLTGDHNDRVKLTLLIDPMSGWTRTSKDELLPPVITQQLTQGQLPRIRPIRPDDLLRHDQGRTSRLVTPALRALLGQLDGEHCRFPGCTRSRKLQAHHVRFWRNGGRTDLANLCLVCSRHHTVIHEQGFSLELQPDRTLTVAKDGARQQHRPAPPWQPKEQLPATGLQASQWNGDRLDLHHLAWVLSQHAA
jgi:hypothetical protein